MKPQRAGVATPLGPPRYLPHFSPSNPQLLPRLASAGGSVLPMAGNVGRPARTWRADRMTPSRGEDFMLSVHHAFVVHLRAAGGPRRARFAGRVEHLSSGRSALFSSLRGLLAFFGPVLDAGGPAAFPGPGDGPGSNVPSRTCRMADPPRDAPAPSNGRSRETPVMRRTLGVLPRSRRPRHREAGKAPAKRRNP